jgi:membrane-bound lytic murein transglycosylase B
MRAISGAALIALVTTSVAVGLKAQQAAPSTPATQTTDPAPAVQTAEPAGGAQTPGAAAPTQTPEAIRPPFADWLGALRAEALERGIKADIVDAAFAGIEEPLPVVLERDRTQAEAVETLETYLSKRITKSVIRNGRDGLTRHRTMLREISSKYGVAPAVIVGVWGLESNFGKFSGVRPTVAALATLAWDPRRATLFRSELFGALEILNRGDIELGKMRGSWAGAMGQPQFMPSSYLKFAEDFDGDGHRDIWSSPGDVFASIANYLKAHGWQAGARWGREVKITPDVRARIIAEVGRRKGTCQATRDMSVSLPLADWTKLGVVSVDGKPLPTAAVGAALVSGASRQFLVYANYDALLEYNCAHAYALGVGLLSDAIGG